VRIEQPEYLVTKKRMPKKPPPPDKPPPPPKLQVASTDAAPAMQLDIDIPNIDVPMGGSGPYIGTWGRTTGSQYHDGDAVPIVRIEPQYPRDALLKGLEGWVRLRFTIREDGSVADVSVIGAEPSKVFNRNAVRAVMRWKFKPRIVDGQPVRRQGQQTIEFKLDHDLYAG
jgi:protein TonB